MKLHPKFVTKNGHSKFVFLPYKEFCKLVEFIENAEDLAEPEKAKAKNKGKRSIPLEEVKKMPGL